jgi:hypothetical protein
MKKQVKNFLKEIKKNLEWSANAIYGHYGR